jgi:osmotically-inducible protein OsmY
LRPIGRGASAATGAGPAIVLGGRRSLEEKKLIMETDRLHGDVIAGLSAYHELDHELVSAGTEVPGCRPVHELASWNADDDNELTGDQIDRLLQVTCRPDADVQREVQRALLLESLVPQTVDARVADGIVTLVGTVCGEQERQDAKQAVGCVPGVLGIIDDLVRLPRGGTGEAAKEEVVAAFARTRFADVAELTVDEPCPGTLVLSGVVRTRRDHDLAIATARSVADVGVVDDCIDLEC